MGLVKLEKDSLTKPAIVFVWFPAWNFPPAEANQCQEEVVAGCCCFFFPYFLLFPPFLQLAIRFFITPQIICSHFLHGFIFAAYEWVATRGLQ